MAQSTISVIVDLEAKSATVTLTQFERWVISGISIDGLPPLPPQRDESYATSDEALAAAIAIIEGVTGERAKPLQR